MRIAITIVCTFLLTTVFGQTDDYKVLLDSAETLFRSERNPDREQPGQSDYNHVASLLEKVIELKPDNAEARYFLGYTYSRINSFDGQGMVDQNLDFTYKSSEQFEKVIQLTPRYTGEIIALDPYSKLTAEWGSMAMCYWYNNKADSAVWALREGKKRGGFGNFILDINKSVLDACSQNSILISSGDIFSIPLWYLQIAENYRKDVAVIDVSLLNTSWYPAFLSKTKSVSFDLPDKVLDTIEYKEWADSAITINNFTWIVKPGYNDHYLFRGDRVLLSLLRQNKFQRELYFTIGFREESRLSLQDFIQPYVFVDKLAVHADPELSYDDYKVTITKALRFVDHLNVNSQDELQLLDYFRYSIFGKVNDFLTNGDKEKAGELMKLMDQLVDEAKYPYNDENGKKYADYFRQSLEN